jgi:hypothetical protein
MKAPWTDASNEVKDFVRQNEVGKIETEYIDGNIKRWHFYANQKDKQPIKIIEQFFDMNFFK